jgi:hypothetical protein
LLFGVVMLTVWVEVISLAAERERPRAHTARILAKSRKSVKHVYGCIVGKPEVISGPRGQVLA